MQGLDDFLHVGQLTGVRLKGKFHHHITNVTYCVLSILHGDLFLIKFTSRIIRERDDNNREPSGGPGMRCSLLLLYGNVTYMHKQTILFAASFSAIIIYYQLRSGCDKSVVISLI